jgi:DNA-binding response OmpR family regulator
LIVEDHIAIGRAVQTCLNAEGFKCTLETRGDCALERSRSEVFDAAVLDIMLPGLDGRALLRELRSRSPALPILLMWARDTVDARVEGLNLGADDYLVKPFSVIELAARLRALLRRAGSSRPSVLHVFDLEIDVVERVARRAGQALLLAPREFDLLSLLAENAGRVVSKQQLMAVVWKVSARATPIDNLLAVHVGRLRRALERDGAPPILHTVRGAGYVLSTDPERWVSR